MSFGGVRDPQRSEPGHVFAPRGRGRPVRGGQGRARRGGGRERGRRADRAVGLRRLSGGAAARRRRQLARTRRDRAELLEPRRPLQRHRRARRGDPLHAAARADGDLATRLPPQGYSDCGPIEFRRGEGTSFSAPLVSAGAALLFASDPSLQADQVSNLLTRSAADANPDTGCIRCTVGRDSMTGWGQLDIGERAGCPRQPAPGGGPLRGERPGRERRLALGPQGPADPRHDRLLGRPPGRLQGPHARWAADRQRSCAAPPARTRTSSSGSRARRPSAPQSPTGGSSPASRRRRAPRRRSA